MQRIKHVQKNQDRSVSKAVAQGDSQWKEDQGLLTWQGRIYGADRLATTTLNQPPNRPEAKIFEKLFEKIPRIFGRIVGS